MSGPKRAGPRCCYALVLFACATCKLIAAPASAPDLPWEVWQSPARLASLGATDLIIEHSSHCPQGCRYDRSNAGPEDPLANPTPERWLYRDGDEVVLFDESGPGALTRFWMTTGNGVSTCIDPSIRIRFRFDDAVTAQVDLPLAQVFDGSTAPFTPPLVADRLASSGGYVSRVPMPYARSLRISLTGAESGANPCTGDEFGLLWYQFTAHRLPHDSDIASFSPAQDFPALRAFLDRRGEDPWQGMLAPQAFSGELQPGASMALAEQSGTGWLRGIRLHVPASERAHIRLRVVIDGATAVDMPLSDYFASAPGSLLPTRSLFFGEGVTGQLYSWWPMPYTQGVAVDLVAGSGLNSAVAASGSLVFDPSPVPADAGRFHAALSERCSELGEIEVLQQRGAGKIVGFASRSHSIGSPDRGYLEGDERVALDDAIGPAWYGTGLEDFFDGGFYFDGQAFSSPLSGASEVDPDGSGTTAAYRIFATDPLVHTRSIRWTQETGYAPGLPVPTCVRHVVHQYRRDQPLTVSLGRFELGDPAQAAAHDYQAPPSAVCVVQSGRYSDEPPTMRMATDCRYAQGSSRFTFRPLEVVHPLRLRRTFDAAHGAVGAMASSAAAEVRVNGTTVGMFPPATANPDRRWQEQEIMLAAMPIAGTLRFEILPILDGRADEFGESAWELSGGWVDPVFLDTFDDSGAGLPRQ